MGMYKYYKDLPPLAKGFVAVVAVSSAFLIGKQVYSVVKSKLDVAKSMRESKEADDEVKKLKKEGIVPTLTDAQVQGMVNSLVTSFAGCGTDEHVVMKVFEQMKNDADVYKLISAYGVRKYDACNWEFEFGDKELSLSAAIADELDHNERGLLNHLLSTRGIAIRF